MALIKGEGQENIHKKAKDNLLDIEHLDTSVYNKPTKEAEIAEFWANRQYTDVDVKGVFVRGLIEKDARLYEYLYERLSHLPQNVISAEIMLFVEGTRQEELDLGSEPIEETKGDIEPIEVSIKQNDIEPNNEEEQVQIEVEKEPKEVQKANEIQNDFGYIEEESKEVLVDMALLNNKENQFIQTTAIQAVQENCGSLDYAMKHSRYKDVEEIVVKMREHFTVFTTDIPKFMQINEKVQKSGVLSFTEKPDTEDENSNSIKTSNEIISMGNNFAMETNYLTLTCEDKKKENQKLDKTIKMLKLILV